MSSPDELEALEWLDNEYFTKILMEYDDEREVIVNNLQVSPASCQGDHYASIMFRVALNYTTQKGTFSKSFILKTMPENGGQKKEMLKDSHLFQTETYMYSMVLPQFEAILQKVGDNTKLYMPVIYGSIYPRKVLVFDDLVPQGYQVIRERPPTIAELHEVLKKLAKWHAVSQKMLKEQPELFDNLKYNLATLPNMVKKSFLTNGLPNFIYMLDEVETLQQYKKFFEPMRANLIQKWAESLGEYHLNPRESGSYVLCHGDFHIRNLMFKENDCMFIDFQLSHVGPLVNDFLYAMYMVFGPEERGKLCNEMIAYYLDIFAETLLKIGCSTKAPSIEEFQQQLIDNKYNEFMLLTTFLPMQIAARKSAIDPFRRRTSMYKDEDYQQEVKYLLERMMQLGYFNE